MIICVYSTAFNNVNSADTSVMSFWRSDYHIIIVDN